jgi:arginine N-succinyltransferase
VTLLSREAQSVIGQVGAQTRGVEKMLRRVGFKYADRVDPFDGGPHFTAKADEVSLVRDARSGTVGTFLEEGAGVRCLLSRDVEGAPFFRAVEARVTFTDEGLVHANAAAVNTLGLTLGDAVYCLPLP